MAIDPGKSSRIPGTAGLSWAGVLCRRPPERTWGDRTASGLLPVPDPDKGLRSGNRRRANLETFSLTQRAGKHSVLKARSLRNCYRY